MDIKKTRTTKKFHCLCLHEIENDLPRTKFCFKACSDQFEILAERKKSEIKLKK